MPATEDLTAAVGVDRAVEPTSALRIAPKQYVFEEGAVGRLGAIVRDRTDAGSVAIVGGERGLQAVRDDLDAALERAGVVTEYSAFDGECTVAAVQAHREALGDGPDLLVGVGGGKALDTAKLVAEGQCPVVTVPTSAATSAAWAALSVVYDDTGLYRGGVPLTSCPDACLLDPAVVADGPSRLLANGLMDASAKFFETSLMDGGDLGPLASLGRSVAEEVYAEPLVQYGPGAVRDARTGEVTGPLRAATEAAVAGPGLAAGLLSDRAYLTLPHVCCYTLLSRGSVQADSLHGERVAYGVLVLQALLEGSGEPMRYVADWYESLGRSMTLAALGAPDDGDAITTLAEDIVADLEYNLLSRRVDAEAVATAIETVESMETKQ